MPNEILRYTPPQHTAIFSPPEAENNHPASLTISGDMPAFARINDITVRFGLPRTRVYELIAAGALEARKDGRAVLVNVASVLRYISALPPANIRLPKTMAKQAATNDTPQQ